MEIHFPPPDSQLWLDSGGRNPEGNKWCSDALNGVPQLGITLNIMPNEILRNRLSGIVVIGLFTAYFAKWLFIVETSEFDPKTLQS